MKIEGGDSKKRQKIVRELQAIPGESIESSPTLRKFRRAGVEVIGVYNGVKFSNMNGSDVNEAYRNATLCLGEKKGKVFNDFGY